MLVPVPVLVPVLVRPALKDLDDRPASHVPVHARLLHEHREHGVRHGHRHRHRHGHVGTPDHVLSGLRKGLNGSGGGGGRDLLDLLLSGAQRRRQLVRHGRQPGVQAAHLAEQVVQVQRHAQRNAEQQQVGRHGPGRCAQDRRGTAQQRSRKHLAKSCLSRTTAFPTQARHFRERPPNAYGPAFATPLPTPTAPRCRRSAGRCAAARARWLWLWLRPEERHGLRVAAERGRDAERAARRQLRDRRHRAADGALVRHLGVHVQPLDTPEAALRVGPPPGVKTDSGMVETAMRGIPSAPQRTTEGLRWV